MNINFYCWELQEKHFIVGLDFSKALVAGAQGKGCPLAFLIIYDVIVIV